MAREGLAQLLFGVLIAAVLFGLPFLPLWPETLILFGLRPFDLVALAVGLAALVYLSVAIVSSAAAQLDRGRQALALLYGLDVLFLTHSRIVVALYVALIAATLVYAAEHWLGRARAGAAQ
jgi:hypothetical protein